MDALDTYNNMVIGENRTENLDQLAIEERGEWIPASSSKGLKKKSIRSHKHKIPYLNLFALALSVAICSISVESATVPDSSLPPSQHGVGLQHIRTNEEMIYNYTDNNNNVVTTSALLQSSLPPPPSQASQTVPRSLSVATASLKPVTIPENMNTNGKENAAMVQNTDNHIKESSDDGENHTNPKTLMLIRLLFITYYGSLGSLMPYLPVYFHSLGHGGQAIGLLGAVKPLTTFIVAPLWGVISDYYQNPSLVLQVTFITSLALQLLLPLKDEVHYLMGMVFLTALFNAPVKSLIDSMVMNKLSAADRGQYGKLRLWGQLGFGLGSSIVGASMSRLTPASTTTTASASAFVNEKVKTSARETMKAFLSNPMNTIRNIQGYKIAFLAYGMMSIPAFIAMQSFKKMNHKEEERLDKSKTNKIAEKSTKGSSPKILQGLNMLLHHGDALLFFSLVLVVGITSGIIENFAYVRIREVGGSGKEMGLCRLVSSLCGAPMFWFSGPLTSKLGADRVLVLALVSYIFRFLNYAFMKHPFHALPAEGMRGIAFAAFWSTGTVFAHKISPPGMSATMVC